MSRAHRLSSHVRPIAYHVDLTADPDRPDFSGRARIEMRLGSRANEIEMHARDLELSNAVIETGKETHPLEVVLDAANQVVRFATPEAIAPGNVAIEVDFRGKLNPGMHGIYLASDGGAKAICTQCEATDARGIFPCFDEPEFKATIRWTVRTKEGLTVLANGPLASQTSENGLRTWSFHPTKPVSSYLAALAIGDFEGGEERRSGDVPQRVWATKGKVSQTNFATEYTHRLIPWFEDYFAVKYPYGKYDQVAVPGFDAGAMENVGLVLFRQNLLLMEPALASWRQEKVIAKVIAHEMAHMWFGNLVTMKWWDDLWLNEAFAEWMAHKAVDKMTPEYRVWDDFQDDKNHALVDDALPVTHPIYTAVESPEQAIEMFDVITYQKGCAVMRMLENFIGEDVFREGLRSYMQAFAYKNAAGADLWHELEKASGSSHVVERKDDKHIGIGLVFEAYGKREVDREPIGTGGDAPRPRAGFPVSTLMKSWVNVAGFPVLSATVVDDARGRSSLQLTQRRFFSDAARAKEDNDQLWNVPVIARFEDDEGVKEHRFIMSDRARIERLPAVGAVKWCYPNANEVGFYRVRPDFTMRKALLEHGLPRLTAVERMGLLEDQWSLVRNGTGKIEAFLDVLQAMASGDTPAIADHNVLRVLADRLSALEQMVDDSHNPAALEGFRGWIRRLLAPSLSALGYAPKSGEAQNDVQRRAILIHAVGKVARDPATLDAAISAADSERRDPKSVDPNLAMTFLAIAALLGDESRYDSWINVYKERKLAGAPPQTTQRYLYTFAEFRSEALIQRTLGLIDDGTIPQEANSPIVGQLLSLRHTQASAWAYLQKNWEALRKRVGDMGLSRVVEACGALPHSRRGEIVSFFRENPPAGADRALSRALERMDEREELRRRITPALVARFGAK